MFIDKTKFVKPEIMASISKFQFNSSFIFFQFHRDIVAVPFETKPYQIAFGPVVDGHKKLLKHNPRHLLKEGEFTDYAVSSLILSCITLIKSNYSEHEFFSKKKVFIRNYNFCYKRL